MEQVANAGTNKAVAANAGTKNDVEFKAKKAAAAKAFKERQTELKTERAKAIGELKAFAEKNKVTLPASVVAWMEKETSGRAGGNGTSFLNKVFGDEPKVGQSITLLDYMKKTFKAKADMDKYCKQWAEKGIVVEFKADAANMLNSTYTIKKLAN